VSFNVDGDADLDVLSASYDDDKIAWYENLSPVGIADYDPAVLPVKHLLYNNYPNPFNPTTNIEFSIPKSELVTLKVYNILGEEVATLVSANLPAGKHKYEWDASDMVSGVYFCRLRAENFMQTRKILLLR
jgi:hypothetical protein